jgi:hypothetical protein
VPQSGLISSPAKPLNACFSGMEFSPALLVRRPDGTWVAIGPELDGIARFISDIAIPNPRDRHGTPRRTPRQPDRTSSRAVHPGAQRHRGRPGHSGSRRGRRLGPPPRDILARRIVPAPRPVVDGLCRASLRTVDACDSAASASAAYYRTPKASLARHGAGVLERRAEEWQPRVHVFAERHSGR